MSLTQRSKISPSEQMVERGVVIAAGPEPMVTPTAVESRGADIAVRCRSTVNGATVCLISTLKPLGDVCDRVAVCAAVYVMALWKRVWENLVSRRGDCHNAAACVRSRAVARGQNTGESESVPNRAYVQAVCGSGLGDGECLWES
jgi:hypothetical protein